MDELEIFMKHVKEKIGTSKLKQKIFDQEKNAWLYENGYEFGFNSEGLYIALREIKVKCIKSHILYNHDKTKANVLENKTYTAILCDLAEKYFIKDEEGREFAVGYIGYNKKFTLNKEFEYC